MLPLLRKKGLFETGRVLYLSTDELQPNPNQPRQDFDENALLELSASIAEHGVLQPLSVRRMRDGFELVAGERRLRAAKRAHLSQVPCIVVDANDEASSLLALVENLQRRDLNYLEEAAALQTLISTYRLSQEEAARRLGKSQSAIANKLRLLHLPADVLECLRHSALTERHARALLRLSSPEAQLLALEHIIKEGLNVAQADAYIEQLLAPPAPKRHKPTIVLRDVRLFLNTITRGVAMMKSAGIASQLQREETPDSILLTITIPR